MKIIIKNKNKFDVFLCHNSADKPFVEKIGEKLKEKGLRPWLDKWELRPGSSWQEELEKQIKNIRSVAVFVGESGIGPWQNEEQKAFIREFVERKKCRVIPVIVRDCKKEPEIPLLLKGMMFVDFRKKYPDPMGELIWGITGQKKKKKKSEPADSILSVIKNKLIQLIKLNRKNHCHFISSFCSRHLF